ncbi:MAG: hypothetical protein HY909_13230 [Deltaproteobacteria bacterium]|nr:hypothetical protein [Deltaproteobacteria bacterium]
MAPSALLRTQGWTRAVVALGFVGLTAGRSLPPTAEPSAPRWTPAARRAPPPGPLAAPRGPTEALTARLSLRAAPFPGTPWPGALVYVPAGLRPEEPLDVLVFFHGWHGCAEAVASDRPVACRPGGHRRGALGLISGVRRSHRRVLLVVPQFGMENTSSAPGALGEDGGLRRLLAEVLLALRPTLGERSVEGLGRVLLASHSAGYVPLQACLSRGGVPVDQVAFFDSLYLGDEVVGRWLLSEPSRLDPRSALPRRVLSVFREGGTEGTSLSLARKFRGALTRAGGPRAVYVRRAANRLEPWEASRPVALVRVPGDHQDAARDNLQAFLEGSLPAPR